VPRRGLKGFEQLDELAETVIEEGLQFCRNRQFGDLFKNQVGRVSNQELFDDVHRFVSPSRPFYASLVSVPKICLSMIVKNEAHIVTEVLDSCAPHISSWSIVDTGSTDGTQDLIRDHMRNLGIPGVLHKRKWRNFGHNQTQEMQLAQGHGDYILHMDADDVFVGQPDFTQVGDADIYMLRVGNGSLVYWCPQLIRDGLPVRCVGVIHAYLVCDDPHTTARLDGDYRIESRRLGAQSRDPDRYARDAALLLAEVERNPEDPRQVFYLAQSYFDAGDYASAREWYERRVQMGGWGEEVFYSMFRVAQSMASLGEPWPQVQDAYLRAWEFRPTRAEPLYYLAVHYRVEGQHHLGHLFAQRATAIPMPVDDVLFVHSDIYSWRAADEQEVCASWMGRHSEALALCRRMLAKPDIPEADRQRILANRDLSASELEKLR
jgi:tetratricopeptide (TPR) repeat protein